jgi:uncharacterized protein
MIRRATRRVSKLRTMSGRTARLQFVMLPALLLAAFPHASAQTSEGPSFSCAHVTSRVNRLVCSSPHLAALDRELALLFSNMQGQPIDHKQLRAGEDAWLAALHRDCQDVACIESRYQGQLLVLRDTSLRVASPAAYEETRPFPAPDSIRLQAEKSVGKPCITRAGLVDTSISGFQPAASFLPIFGPGYVVVVRQSSGHLFAFLISAPLNGEGCLVSDEISLPPTVQGSSFLQCSNQDPAIAGFGIHSTSNNDLLALWTVEGIQLHFRRIPTHVVGIEKTIRCRQPEGAD